MQKPQPFGKYYLLERINVGGMAEVFKAKAFGVEGFERLVAVKRILPSVAQDEEFIRMFIDEAKIAVQLNHANIAQIFDLGMADGAYYIALEYVPGKDLRAIFENSRKTRRPVTIPQACYAVLKICEGLDYAHNKKDAQGRELHIVHRDVSPQNVLVSHEGEVKVIDFGIAKAAGRASRTKAGILKGKFGYMSPEQVRGLPLDRRSDIFSLGIILYEMLTMERLFVGESDFATLEKVRNVEILPPTTYNRNIPEDLEDIVLKALSRDPNDRYSSSADFHDALQRFLFTSGLFYSRKDLADYMKECFGDDIELEHRKIEQYRHLKPPVPQRTPLRPPLPPPPSGVAGGAAARDQEDEIQTVDVDTQDLIDLEKDDPLKVSAPHIPSAMRAKRRESKEFPGLMWDEDDDETAVYDREPSVVAEVERKPISTAAEIVWAKSPPRDDIPPTQDVRPRRNRGRARAVVFLSGFTLFCVGMAATFVWYVVTVRTGGTLELETVPAIVEVLVDNQLVHTGTTPITLQGLTRGPHIILVRAEGHREESKHVDVVDGVKSRLLIQLTRGPPPVGSVRVVTEPAGARVTIDGRLREGTTPMVIGGLTPGPHTVGADKPPHLVGERVVEVKEARTQDIAVPLAARSVSLKLTSSPSGALFRIEDSEGELHAEGATPDEVGELLSGNAYKIQITLKGRRNWNKRYTPVGVGPHTLHADLLSASGRSERRSLRGGRAVASRRPNRTRRPAPVDSEDAPPIRPVRREIPAPTPAPIAARAPAPAQAAYGLLNLNAKPWAKVFIDGRDTGQSTPMLGQRLPVGRRKITLVNGRFGIHKEFWVDIRPGKTSQLIVDLQQ